MKSAGKKPINAEKLQDKNYTGEKMRVFKSSSSFESTPCCILLQLTACIREIKG
jgi:hypothetical protein